MEGTSVVYMVPFGSGITELRMRENHDFVVPVNILTPFVCPVSWVTQHTTVCLDFNHCKLTVSVNKPDI